MKTWKKWLIGIGVAFVALCVVAVITAPEKKKAASSVTTTQISPVTTTRAPAPTTTAVPHAQVISAYESGATSVSVSQLANDPSKYNGDSVTFQAQIVDFLQNSGGATTAMNVSDPNDLTSVVYVQLSQSADPTQMNKGDTVTIFGNGAGTASGKNDFGGTIQQSAVIEEYMSDQTTGYADTANSNPEGF